MATVAFVSGGLLSAVSEGKRRGSVVERRCACPQPRRRARASGRWYANREDTVDEQRQRFYNAIVAAEAPLDLFEALLCIADGENSQRLDADAYRILMQRWCDDLRAVTIKNDGNPKAQLKNVNDFFFGKLGFRRVRNEDFHDPNNSLLHEVMRRRVGIPISLCVLYRELCRRTTGLRVEGVNFPAHFLLRVRTPRTMYINPSDSAQPFLGMSDLRELLLSYFSGDPIELTDDMLQTADERAIVTRVLRNLKTAYLKVGSNDAALSVMDRLILLSPTTSEERRDRGLLLHIMGRGREGLRDLEFCIALERGTPDAVVLRALIQRYQTEEDEDSATD